VTPSVFVKASLPGSSSLPQSDDPLSWFKCPECNAYPLNDRGDHLHCPGCGKKWAFHDGIYDFREAIS
jgi:hypothetical protein